MNTSRWLNLGLYEAGWFAAVLGGAYGAGTLGGGIAFALIAVHLWLIEDWRREAKLIAFAILIGVAIDSLHVSLGVLSFPGAAQIGLVPLWIAAIWAGFATTLHFSLRWLSKRYLLAGLLGAVAGPFAFFTGERLGAVGIGVDRSFSFGVLAVSWSLVLPLLVWIADRLALSGEARYMVRTTPMKPGLASTRRPAMSTLSIALALLLGLGFPFAAEARIGGEIEVDGARFSRVVQAKFGPKLEVRGASDFTYLGLIDVFSGAFYVDAKAQSASYREDVAKRLELQYARSFSADDFIKATNEGIALNVSRAELKRLQTRIDRLNRAYRNVREGDRYAVTYIPGLGTELALNGRPLVMIPGADFSVAFLSIWLGQKCIDEDLRDELLGKSCSAASTVEC